MVVGSSTLLMKHSRMGGTECFHYDPLGVIETGIDTATGLAVRNDPVTSIPFGRGILPDGNSFVEMASSRGTIFMYEHSQGDGDDTMWL